MTYLYQIHTAKQQDLPTIKSIMTKSIEVLQKSFLSNAQVKASYEVMGLDTQLIDDGTYFTVWAVRGEQKTMVGCGGWSNRKTLYGGNHSKGRSAALLDPAQDAARIRAMYTHPDWARRGIGTLILGKCEDAALAAGFTRAEMMATMAGVPLYEARGYTRIEAHTDIASDGTEIPLVKMGKALS